MYYFNEFYVFLKTLCIISINIMYYFKNIMYVKKHYQAKKPQQFWAITPGHFNIFKLNDS